MPLNKSAFYRYLLIDKRINDPYKAPFPTLKDLMDYIEEKSGQRISKRQLEEDDLGNTLQRNTQFLCATGISSQRKRLLLQGIRL
jgi:hypothetical protein